MGSSSSHVVTNTAYCYPPLSLGVRITHGRVRRHKRWGWTTAALSRPGLDVGCQGPIARRSFRTRPLWLLFATT